MRFAIGLILSLLYISTAYSQTSPHIKEVSVYPVVLKSNLDIFIVTKIVTPNNSHRINSSFKITGDTVFINSCYYDGFITAITEQTDTFKLGKLSGGNYNIKFTANLSNDEDTCKRKNYRILTKMVNVIDATSITEPKNYIVNSYPNPVIDILYFKGKQFNRIRVYNILGQVVLDKQIPYTTNHINLAGLEKGIYLIEFTDLLGRINRDKVIKK